MHNKKLILFAAIFFLFSGQQFANADVGNAGAINTHAMDILKQNLQLQQAEQDFQKNKNNQENQQGSQSTQAPETNANTAPVVKAKLSEFKTKGVYIEKVIFTSSKFIGAGNLVFIILDVNCF